MSGSAMVACEDVAEWGVDEGLGVSEAVVAIVGASGRFPGARSVSELWSNSLAGIDVSTTLSDEELIAEGFTSAECNSGAVVRRRYLLADADRFDAHLFGYAPAEADVIDPQQRIALECVWELFESAGYDPRRYDGAIGAFCASGFNSYLLTNVARNPVRLKDIGLMSAMLGNTKDFVTTRLAYHFDLRGPAVTVATGCSAGLVAVHQAAQSLLNAECDMAVAGGVTVIFPQTGYRYQPGGTNSADGLCRAFDAAADGTAPGDAAAFVLLKRYDDALADGDHILGLLAGTAINNDGSAKIGFTAPSLSGQSAVVAEALGVAGFEAADVSYVEAHGTGTPLGDAIEVAALTDAFGDVPPATCRLGSVKTLVGHTDAAAGVTGLINILGALAAEQIPGVNNLTAPSAKLGLSGGPFVVDADRSPWPRSTVPRVAGVSSFGIGGTNAHAIVTDAPVRDEPALPAIDLQRWQVARVNAADPEVLRSNATALADWLDANPDANAAQVAHTLTVARSELRYRHAAVGRDAAELAAALRAVPTATEPSDRVRTVGFIFPGQGAQQVRMAADLYRSEPGATRIIDDGIRIVRSMGTDLADVLTGGVDDAWLTDTAIIQPALFITEYACAQVLLDWGIHPVAVGGHSLGELVAAVVAGALTWEQGCAMAAIRGQLMAATPAGATLAVAADETVVRDLLAAANTATASIAAVNGPAQVVVSGAAADVATIARHAAQRELKASRLSGRVGVHSPLMDAVASDFADRVAALGDAMSCNDIDLISGLTGQVITDAEISAKYWARHLREPVRFADTLDALRTRCDLLVEVGPGDTLRGLAAATGRGRQVLTTLGRANGARSGAAGLARAAARLWAAGVPVDRPATIGPTPRSRITLPTYRFRRDRHWIEPIDESGATPHASAETAAPVGAAASSSNLSESDSGSSVELVMAVWREVLGVQEISETDDFYDVGGHSLLAANVRSVLQRRTGVELTVADLLGDPTVAGMASSVDDVRSRTDRTSGRAVEQMRADVTTWARPQQLAASADARSVENILITGATGFVGAFVLAELLATSSADVWCLVRADSDAAARTRIVEVLKYYERWDDSHLARLHGVAGDVADPQLGLTTDSYTALRARIDLIVHGAARVDVSVPYATLRDTNVAGTAAVFAFARGPRPIPVAHISTSGVVTDRAGQPGEPILESTRLAAEGIFDVGYPQSKWVAEQIALRARDDGLPVAIFRPHRVSPDPATGLGAFDDAMWRIITACLELGVAPDIPAGTNGLNFVPVDYVGAAIARLAIALAQGQSDDTVADYHLANPHLVELADIFDVARDLGYECEQLDFAQWAARIEAAALMPDAPASVRTAALITGAADDTPALGSIVLDCANTERALANSSIRCAPLDAATIARYLRRIHDSGLLRAGTHAATRSRTSD